MKQSLKYFLTIGLMLLSGIVVSATNEQLYALQKSTVSGNEVFLNGMGEIRKLQSDYYVAALYLKDKSNIDSDIVYYETPKKISLRFGIDRVSARSYGRELAGSLKINNVSEELQAYRNELRTLIGLFKGTYKKGDTLTFEYVPKKGVRVLINDTVLGTIDKSGFDKVLFKAWLGDKPPSAAFKSGLVGRNKDKEAIDLLNKYVDSEL